jgi:xanthine/CO dehydrogenase XdhC/CoxF family maturation factor
MTNQNARIASSLALALLTSVTGCGGLRVGGSSLFSGGNSGGSTTGAAGTSSGNTSCDGVTPVRTRPPTLDDDLQQLRAINKDVSGSGTYVFDSHNPQVFPAYLKLKPLLAATAPKYQGWFCAARRHGDPGLDEAAFVEFADSVASVEKTIAAQKPTLPGRTKKALDEANKALAGCCAEGTNVMIELAGPRSTVAEARRNAAGQVKVLAIAYPDGTPELTEATAGLASLDDAITQRLSWPKSQYHGPDARAVVGAIGTEAKSLYKKPVISVTLVEDHWARTTTRAADQGFLTGLVALDAGDGKATVYAFRPRKDYRDGGKLKFDTFIPVEYGTFPKRALKL